VEFSLQDRPSRTVARLAAEFVVIVTGVLVALGMEAWAQARQDRERELAYLSDLHDELVVSIDAASQVVLYETQLSDYRSLFEGSVAEGGSASTDSLALWFDGTLRSAGYRPGAAIADALIDTGDLSLIQSAEIRRRVIEYREQARQTREAANVFDASSLDAVASINRRVDRDAIRRAELSRRDWEQLASDPIVRGDLLTHAIGVTARLRSTQRFLDLATALKEEVAVELRSRGRPPGGAR
jgi:hypothetical protein